MVDLPVLERLRFSFMMAARREWALWARPRSFSLEAHWPTERLDIGTES